MKKILAFTTVMLLIFLANTNNTIINASTIVHFNEIEYIIEDEIIEGIDRNLFNVEGISVNMYDELNGYILYTVPTHDSYDNTVFYTNYFRFFQIVLTPSTYGNSMDDGGEIRIVYSGKSTYVTYMTSDYYYSDFLFYLQNNISEADFRNSVGGFDNIIIDKSEDYTQTKIAISNVSYNLSITNGNALNISDGNYDVSQDKGRFFTSYYVGSVGTNATYIDTYDIVDFISDQTFCGLPLSLVNGTDLREIIDYASTFIPSPYDQFVDAAFFGYDFYRASKNNDYIEYSPNYQLPIDEDGWSSDRTDYYNQSTNEIEHYFVRSIQTSQNMDISDQDNTPILYLDDNYIYMEYSTAGSVSPYLEDNLMRMYVDISFSVGVYNVSGSYHAMEYFSTKVDMLHNTYDGFLEKGYYNVFNKKYEDERAIYTLIPDITGYYGFDSLSNDDLHLYDQNGSSINLVETAYDNHRSEQQLIAGKTYYVTSENINSDELSIRYTRVASDGNTMCGFVDFPTTFTNYSDRDFIYNIIGNGKRIFNINSNFNGNYSIEIYDANWNLLRTSNSSLFSYYFIRGNVYYIKIKTQLADDNLGISVINFRMKTVTSTC